MLRQGDALELWKFVGYFVNPELLPKCHWLLPVQL